MSHKYQSTVLYRTHPEAAQLVTHLHELSEYQDAQNTGISSLNNQDVQKRDFSMFKDKMVALEQDKAELIYAVLRGKNASRVFEAGTSYGVSTIYLLLASQAANKPTDELLPPMVWGTEKEDAKADAAIENLAQAIKLPKGTKEVAGFTMLRGDILETTKAANIQANSLDAVLFDIWAESKYHTPSLLSHRMLPLTRLVLSTTRSVALPTFKLLEASLKQDAVIFIDNWLTGVQIGTYSAFKEYLEEKGWYVVALPFKNGLGMATRVA